MNQLRIQFFQFVLRLFTKKQTEEYIRRYQSFNDWFENEEINKIEKSLQPFIQEMTENKQERIQKREEVLENKIYKLELKQQKEQLKQQKLREREEKKKLLEEKRLLREQKKRESDEKKKLLEEKKLLRQQKKQQSEEKKAIREEKKQQSEAKELLRQQKKQQSEEKKQQQSEEKKLLREQKKIEKDEEKKQLKEQKKRERLEKKKQQEQKPKQYKKQETQFKQRTQFKHNKSEVNGLENHKISLEITQDTETDYNLIIDFNYQRILDILLNVQKQQNYPFKVNVYLVVEVSEFINEKRVYSTYPLSTEYYTVNDLQSQLSKVLHKFDEIIQIKIGQLGHSGLGLERILYAQVNALQYQQQGVGNYIKIEGLLDKKNCCINIQNKDEQCSIYCFLYFYYTKVLNHHFENYKRPNNYNYHYDQKEGILYVYKINKTEINKSFHIGNVKFPVNIDNISKIAKGFGFTYTLFEHQSSFIKEKEIIEVRVVNNQRMQQGVPHIDLLMLQNDEEERLNTHLVYVKDFNRFIYQSDKKETKYYCRNCLNYYYKQEKLIIHEQYCYNKETPSTDEYPKEGYTIKFKSQHKQQQLPFFIVADTEALVQKLENEQVEQELIDDGEVQYNSKTKKLAKHTMVSYGFYVYDQHNLLDKHYYEYVQQQENENVAIDFIDKIYNVSNKIMKLITDTKIPYENTEEVRMMKQQATKCYICNVQFTEKDHKVVDHDHFTGKVRGIAHNECNLHYHLQRSKIPVIFHNLRSYDGHFIIKNIAEYMKQNNMDMKVDCIANNSEKFMSITWDNVRFIDSIQFMPASLQSLADNLSFNQKQITMKYLEERFKNRLTQQEIEGILVKGHFPYSWFNSIKKLVDNQLPSRQAFYNDLTNEQLGEKQYKQSVDLFNKLGFNTFRQWLLLYQQVDVLLLTDIWINFRNSCLQNYKLDPGHYYSSPGLSWEAMLKITEIELDLIHDPEIYMMFEKQSRGGISITGNVRYARSNNKYCPDYDQTKDDSYLLYVDANNLYGESMMQKLPYKKFKFIKEKDLLNYGETFVVNYQNGDKGYVYDVDLLYPQHLHDSHYNYPLAPEQLIINYDMIIQYNKDAIDNLKTKEDIKIVIGNQKKLTPNLMNKKNYVCNIRNLKLYLQQGLKIEKINRIIQFQQKDYMRPYIELNTQLRQKANNKFEKDFFKLMNNSVFGKTCENVRKRANYELVSNEKRMRKVVNSRYFKNYIKISDNLALVEKHQKVVKLNKPSYVGMQVLDLSKITMYNYHYNHIMKQNFKKVDLLLTDTDSLFLSITTQKGQDLYDNMIHNSDVYDFSEVTKGELYEKIKNYCKEKQLDMNQFLNKNKAIVGKFKNETPNSHIIEAVSIKSKCYGFITTDDQSHKKLKGVKKCVVKKDITHQDYKDSVLEQKIKKVVQKSLRSYNHEIYTIEQEKLALQSYNDKKFILQDGITCLSYGNYKIGQEQFV